MVHSFLEYGIAVPMDGRDSETNINFFSSYKAGESHDIEKVAFYSSINDDSSDHDREENEESSEFFSKLLDNSK